MDHDYPRPLTEQDMRIFRYIAIFVILGVIFVATIFGGMETCKEVASSGDVVRVCNPPSLTDMPIIVGAFAILLLLMPDLSQAELLGILSLKRRTDAVEAEVRALRAESTSTSRAGVVNVISGILHKAQLEEGSPEAALSIVEQVAHEIDSGYSPTPSGEDAGRLFGELLVDRVISERKSLIDRAWGCLETRFGAESVTREPEAHGRPDLALKVHDRMVAIDVKPRVTRSSIERIAKRYLEDEDGAAEYAGVVVFTASDAPDVSGLQGSYAVYAVSNGECDELESKIRAIVAMRAQ